MIKFIIEFFDGGKKSDSQPMEWLPAKGGTLHFANKDMIMMTQNQGK